MIDSGRLVPVPRGPVQQISVEATYAAFPYTIRTPGGEWLCSYVSKPTHNAGTGNLLHRRSVDGIAWGEAYQMPGQSAGWAWGHGGIAAETPAQGGRIYLALLALHFTSVTVDTVKCWMKWSDDDGLSWQLGPFMPVVNGKGWYPSGLLVLADGSVLASGYTNDGYARYYLSTDRGASWAPAGTAKPFDRGVGEPTLVQLPDGHLVSFLRSDVPVRRLYRTDRADITAGGWSDPIVASYDQSGLPNATVINNEFVVVTTRGYADISNPALGMYPTRLGLFEIDPAAPGGLFGYRANVDPWPGSTGRMLYGNVVEVSDGWRLIVGVEGPITSGVSPGAASVVSIPLEFRTI